MFPEDLQEEGEFELAEARLAAEKAEMRRAEADARAAASTAALYVVHRASSQLLVTVTHVWHRVRLVLHDTGTTTPTARTVSCARPGRRFGRPCSAARST